MTASWSAGTVVLPDRVLTPGTVVVEGGRITSVHSGVRFGDDDFGPNAIIAPGAVDLHSDAVEKLAEPRPGVRLPFPIAVRSLDRRLAGAGVTTAFAALSLAGDEIGLRERLATEALACELRALAQPHVDHRLHLRVEITDEGSVAAAEELLAVGVVHLLSVMNHTPGQGQFTSIDSYLAFYARNYAMSEPDLRARIGVKLAAGPHLDARLTRLAYAADRAGVPLAWHDPDSPGTIAQARSYGATIAEFPTTAAAAYAAAPAGLTVAMGAPNLLLRRSTSGNLSATDALAAGALDLLVSDYYPEAMWPAALGSGLPLPEAVRLVTAAPAAAAGLADRGVLAAGHRADLVALHADGSVIRVMAAGRIVA
jgi:alpha-D-ribose 1-methylphosphonate 5-triphosphate diphosphatase